MSGVILQGLEHGLVAQRVHADYQTSATRVNRQADPTAIRDCLGAKAQLQPLLNQTSQGCALPSREGLGVGEKDT